MRRQKTFLDSLAPAAVMMNSITNVNPVNPYRPKLTLTQAILSITNPKDPDTDKPGVFTGFDHSLVNPACFSFTFTKENTITTQGNIHWLGAGLAAKLGPST